MDIQEDFLNMQIAFEKFQAKDSNCDYEELKQRLDHCEKLSGHRYLPMSPRSEAWLVWGAAWQAAKAKAVPESNALLSASLDAVQKLGSGNFVLVPKERLAKAVDGIEALFEEDCTLALGELLPIQQDLNAMIEAQEQANE